MSAAGLLVCVAFVFFTLVMAFGYLLAKYWKRSQPANDKAQQADEQHPVAFVEIVRRVVPASLSTRPQSKPEVRGVFPLSMSPTPAQPRLASHRPYDYVAPTDRLAKDVLPTGSRTPSVLTAAPRPAVPTPAQLSLKPPMQLPAPRSSSRSSTRSGDIRVAVAPTRPAASPASRSPTAPGRGVVQGGQDNRFPWPTANISPLAAQLATQRTDHGSRQGSNK